MKIQLHLELLGERVLPQVTSLHLVAPPVSHTRLLRLEKPACPAGKNHGSHDHKNCRRVRESATGEGGEVELLGHTHSGEHLHPLEVGEPAHHGHTVHGKELETKREVVLAEPLLEVPEQIDDELGTVAPTLRIEPPPPIVPPELLPRDDAPPLVPLRSAEPLRLPEATGAEPVLPPAVAVSHSWDEVLRMMGMGMLLPLPFYDEGRKRSA